MRDKVLIANGQGFWGDSILGPVRLVREGPLDYLAAQAPILVHYLALSVWPVGQVLDYGRFVPVPLVEALLPGSLLAAGFAATCWGLVRGSPLAFLPFV